MKPLRKSFRFLKDENGAVMVIAALGLVAFLSIASLVTDLGLKYYQKSRMQNAMDAAALAAVTYLPDKVKAREVALDYVAKNGFDTAQVVIEFPEEGVIRVTDSYVQQTLFAGIMGETDMNVEAHAAAKYLNKSLAIDFDYLMFYGEDSTFFLNGDFREVAGSIFGNGDIRVGCNDAAVIYNIVSARSIIFTNNMPYTPVTNLHAAHQNMPDWDEMIMSIAPTAEKEQFTDPCPHLMPDQHYKYRLSGGTYSNGALSYVDGSVYCSGTLNTGYTSNMLYVRGDLYVAGDFTPQCPVYVTGSVYVGGNFNATWGMSFFSGGKMYVGGNATFQGQSTVNGLLYCGGNITLTNGSSTLYKFGGVRCLGNFSSTSAWNARVTINGSIFVYGKLALGGGINNITGSVNVWGHNATNDEDVCYINGDLYLSGDVWCHKGIVAFGGNGDCVIHGMIYSAGRVETRSGGDISLNGCIIAEGDIIIGGASHTYNDAGATLSLYSRNGNIVLGSQGTELKMWGIVYAPKGDIKISTDGLRVFGSLVANTITCNIGCGFYIGRNDRTLPFAKTVRAAALIE